tara:strand:+ start:28 stop:381 length:354 start_codon:yes stop_codon:yes gene_type:complete
MGILDDIQTCNGIDNEWELCTPELFQTIDVSMYNIITNPYYKIPQLAPDGNYCPNLSGSGDVNNDGNINIQDIILTINIILNNLEYNNFADTNNDGNINILDIVLITNIILGIERNN